MKWAKFYAWFFSPLVLSISCKQLDMLPPPAPPVVPVQLPATTALSFSSVPAAALFYDPDVYFAPWSYASAPQYYSYSPSVVNLNGNQFLYSCQNAQSNFPNSYISISYYGLNQTLISNVVFGPNSGNSTAFDNYSVCDPSVVGGSFSIGTGISQKSYNYAMFYSANNSCNNNITGNTCTYSSGNGNGSNTQIGVAFSNSLEGPWERISTPLISYSVPSTISNCPNANCTYGVGKPSAIVTSASGGQVLLFYTIGDALGNRTVYQNITLQASSAGFPQSSPVILTTSGLVDSDGTADYLNNASFLYDSYRSQFFMIREGHPYPLNAVNTTFGNASSSFISPTNGHVSTFVSVAVMPAAGLLANNGTWTEVGRVNADVSLIPANTSAGFERDINGNLVASDVLNLFFTSSCVPSTYGTIYTSWICTNSSSITSWMYNSFKIWQAATTLYP